MEVIAAADAREHPDADHASLPTVTAGWCIDNFCVIASKCSGPTITKAGFCAIIGLRDVRPIPHADIPKLEANLPKYLKTSLIPVDFVLAILEIEAWFLAEATHYPKIDPAITVAAIRGNLGFDPEADDMEQRLTPAEDLNKCYAIGGKIYNKRQAQTHRTIDALDFAIIYMQFPMKFRYVARFVDSLNRFLT